MPHMSRSDFRKAQKEAGSHCPPNTARIKADGFELAAEAVAAMQVQMGQIAAQHSKGKKSLKLANAKVQIKRDDNGTYTVSINWSRRGNDNHATATAATLSSAFGQALQESVQAKKAGRAARLGVTSRRGQPRGIFADPRLTARVESDPLLDPVEETETPNRTDVTSRRRRVLSTTL